MGDLNNMLHGVGDINADDDLDWEVDDADTDDGPDRVADNISGVDERDWEVVAELDQEVVTELD